MASTLFAQLTVVTVDYNRHADTLSCLDSLRTSNFKGLRIIAVDNGSEDPLQLPPDACQDVEIMRQESNLGFAVGFNMGIRRASRAEPMRSSCSTTTRSLRKPYGDRSSLVWSRARGSLRRASSTRQIRTVSGPMGLLPIR